MELFADFNQKEQLMFIGRKNELKLLEDAYSSNKSCLAVIYGRRRIGKSSLVKQFSLDKPYFFSFEAVENEDTEGQIEHFTSLLKEQVNDSSLSNIKFKNWRDVFIDLLYKRMDHVVTVCEIKYHNKEITTAVIPEMEQRLKLLKVPRGYTVEKALISLYGPDKSLMNSGYFNHHIKLEDLLGPAARSPMAYP